MKKLTVGGVLLCLSVWLNPFGTAAAGVTYISQDRSVSAWNDKGLAQTITAPDFAPFDDFAHVSWEQTVPPGWSSSYNTCLARAEQTSIIAASRIATEGDASEGGPPLAFEYHSQLASSYFEVTFETTTRQDFALMAEVYAWGDYGGDPQGQYRAWFTLSNVQLGEIGEEMSGGEGFDRHPPILFNEVLSLDPGRYTLIAGASARGGYGPFGYQGPGVGGGGYATYSLQLTPVAIPAPGAVLLGAIGVGLIGWLEKRRIV